MTAATFVRNSVHATQSGQVFGEASTMGLRGFPEYLVTTDRNGGDVVFERGMALIDAQENELVGYRYVSFESDIILTVAND